MIDKIIYKELKEQVILTECRDVVTSEVLIQILQNYSQMTSKKFLNIIFTDKGPSIEKILKLKKYRLLIEAVLLDELYHEYLVAATYTLLLLDLIGGATKYQWQRYNDIFASSLKKAPKEITTMLDILREELG